MDYAVVIRTKNSEQTLEDCLIGVFSQTVKPRELVIVDSGSTDSTLSIAEKFSVTIIHYPSKEFNYSKALNIGISSLTSKYILCLSSHVKLVEKRSLELMLRLHQENHNCAAVSFERTSKSENTILDDSEVHWKKINLRNFRGHGMYNFCSLFLKEKWEEFKFDERIGRCEDQLWIMNFLKKNFSSIIISSPKVFYCNPYYNSKKDALDYVVLGKTVAPSYISRSHMQSVLKGSLMAFKKRDFKKSLFLFKVFYYLLISRNLELTSIKSTYNKKLS